MCVEESYGCSLFGSPSSEADGVAHNLETKQTVDSPSVQKNPIILCSLFGSPSSKPDEMLVIWNLMELLTKCDNPCVQKNHTGCSFFGLPSSKADGVVCVPSETCIS